MLLKDREVLILSSLDEQDDRSYLVDREGINNSPLNLTISNVDKMTVVANDCIFVDADKIRFPLTLRKWQENDVFYPFGMDGKKLISKYFKDEKMSLHDKSDAWLLLSDDQIVWVVGKRADDRFKVTPESKTILQISTST